MTLPSPTDLTYFSAVALQKNLSRAAKILNVSQPSLTLAMQRVEEAVGTALFIRHKRGVTLTKAGEQLLSDTHSLLNHWQEIKAKSLASANDVQGTVTIGCHPSVAMRHLGKVIPALTKKYSKLNIQLVHDLSRRITDQIIQMTVDIAISVNPFQHQDLVITPLRKDNVLLWENKKIERTQNQIICDPALLQTQFILKNLKQHQIAADRIITSNNLDVIASLTYEGAGMGILPTCVANHYKLSKIMNSPCFEDEVCLIYRGENRNVRAIQVIAEEIKKVAKSKNECVQDPSQHV